MPRTAKRITVKMGKRTRSVVITQPPYPEVGDELNWPGGDTGVVTRVKDEQIFAEFSTEGGKLRQVFP